MERATKRLAWRCAAGAIAAALLGACGGPEASEPSGRSMAASASRDEHAGNEAPTVERVTLEPQTPRAGALVQARVAVRDPDGNPVELQYLWRVGGRQTPASGSSLVVPETARKDTPIEVEVIARDRAAASEPVRASVRVGNRPPTLASVQLEPQDGVKVGEELVAVGVAGDPDGDRLELSHEWRVNDRPVPGDRERFSTAGLKRGDRIVARVRASDGDDETPPRDSDPVSVLNSAPQIVSTPRGLGADGQFRYSLEVQDADGDRNLRYALVSGPPGARVDPLLGEVTWTASRENVGNHVFEVEVQDGHGGKAQQRFEVDVREVDPNQLAGAAGADATPAAIE